MIEEIHLNLLNNWFFFENKNKENSKTNNTIIESYIANDSSNSSILSPNELIKQLENLKNSKNYINNNISNNCNKYNNCYLTVRNISNISENIFKQQIEEKYNLPKSCEFKFFGEEYNYNSYDKNNIYSISTFYDIRNLIENYYKNDVKNLNNMKNKYELMKKDHIKYYRKIKGDGNCFYRSVIIKYLEVIILNRHLEIFRNIIYDIEKVLNDKEIYIYLNIKNNTINPKSIMFIFLIIYDKLLNYQIENAYNIFMQALNRFKIFDFSLILYLRFIIYKYLKDNENKLYIETFPINIGNLLPEKYETQSGKFLFEKFYKEYLMKMFQDAEKIIIYIIPFVLGINLNILFFETKEINWIKEFKYCGTSNIQIKESIYVIYKNNHYETIYLEEEINKHNFIYKNYINKNNNIQFLKQFNDIENNNYLNNNNLKDKNLFNNPFRDLMEKNINLYNQTKNNSIKKDINLNENKEINGNNFNNINISNDNKSLNNINNEKEININLNLYNKQNSSPFISIKKCNYCNVINNNFLNSSKNPLKICDKCLIYNLNQKYILDYLNYVSFAKQIFNKNSNCLKDLKKEIFKLNNSILNINNQILSIIELIQILNKCNINYNFDDYKFNCKQFLCINCLNKLKEKNNPFLKLPCNCVFCSKECFENFFEKDNPILNPNLKENFCFCCTLYEAKEYIHLGKNFSKIKKDFSKVLCLYKKYSQTICCFCSRSNDLKKINTNEKKFIKFFELFEHYICRECNLNKKCIFCNLFHNDLYIIN